MKYNPKKHYDNAQNFISNKNYRHACLELRLCYESFIYNMLENQIGELPEYIIKQWQPKQIIKKVELLAPNFSDKAEISYSLTGDAYNIPPDDSFVKLAEKKSLSNKFFKCYHKLGSALHATSLFDIKKSNNPESKFERIANEASLELNDVINNPSIILLDINKIECADCKHENIFSSHMIEKEIFITCDNQKCNAKLKAYKRSNNEIGLKIFSILRNCTNCMNNMSIPIHLNIDGGFFKCDSCNTEYHYKSNFEYAAINN